LIFRVKQYVRIKYDFRMKAMFNHIIKRGYSLLTEGTTKHLYEHKHYPR